MIEAFGKLFKEIISLLLRFIFVFVVVFVAWNIYQESKKAETFVTTFSEVSEITSGTPVYALGVKVGKVKKIFPIVNEENKLGVEIRITKKDFPVPGDGTTISIVPSSGKSGDPTIELSNIQQGSGGFYSSSRPFSQRDISKIMYDFWQLSKDFSNYGLKQLKKPEVQHYRSQLQTSVKKITESIKDGTLKDQAEDQIAKLNQMEIKLNSEIEGLDETDKEALQIEMQALQNTIRSMLNVSDLYDQKDKLSEQALY